jgi:hypothetical protein
VAHGSQRLLHLSQGALVAGLLVAGAVACGPSFQAIYEGDARFEHCYALDDDPSAPLQSKADCWSEWTKRYTYGQTRDRVEYAAMRYRALSRVPASPTDEAMMGAAPGEGKTTSSVTAPAPTNAFEPPPKTLPDGDAGVNVAAHRSGETVRLPAAPAPPPSPPPPKPADTPRASCLSGCGDSWHDCKGACAAAASGCPQCDKTYARCVKACF